MKASKFNRYYKIDNKTTLVFNSWSAGLAIVDSSYDNMMRSIEQKIPYSELSDELKKTFDDAYNGHFIVDDDCDEIKEYYLNRNYIRFSTNTLILTIAPTLLCNFRCPYCYEEVKEGVMPIEIQEKLLDYIQENADKIKHLDITWYGGEPLISIDIIERLSQSIMSICSDNRVDYQASMVTNGYLLDDNIIEKLIKYNVKALQITLDGSKEVHDQRRFCANGQGSYDKIVENINKLLEIGIFDISIRVNIDKTNIADVENLLIDLDKKLINKKFNLYLAPVGSYNEVCKSIESKCFNEEEYAKEFVRNYKLLDKYGFANINSLYPKIRFVNCAAESLANFVIDPDGYMYKCWDHVGIKEKAVGSLKNSNRKINSWRNLASIERKFADKEKCDNCLVLPLCAGGCYHKEQLSDNHTQCDDIRLTLDYRLTEYYNKLKS